MDQYSNQNQVHISPISSLVFLTILIIGFAISMPDLKSAMGAAVTVWVITLIIAWIISASVKTASQWERVIILRLGKFSRISGPGIFFMIPILENIPYWVDIRTVSIPIKEEQTITKDNVPVSVEAIQF